MFPGDEGATGPGHPELKRGVLMTVICLETGDLPHSVKFPS